MIYNCFISENYTKLQQGHSSIILMDGWESKKLKKFKIGEVPKVSEIGIKQVFKQKVSFRRISVTMRNNTNY